MSAFLIVRTESNSFFWKSDSHPVLFSILFIWKDVSSERCFFFLVCFVVGNRKTHRPRKRTVSDMLCSTLNVYGYARMPLPDSSKIFCGVKSEAASGISTSY